MYWLNGSMTEIALDELMQVAVRAAKAAGDHAQNNRARRKEVNESFAHDVKLVLDMEAQKAAEEVIFSTYPDHAILGEEEEIPNDAADYEWVIDPIDGTMNFSHGFEYWCSSVAVRQGQTIIAGCVYAPQLNALYTAHHKGEATLNGETIRISAEDQLKNSLIMTGISKEMETAPEFHFQLFKALELNTKKVRINGAAALDLCKVADGTGDGFYESGIYLWDYAAAGLIAQQAGASLKVYPRKDVTHGATVLCANKALLEELNQLYTDHLAGINLDRTI
jgi:myo-inositol-1(or 4)-monophosphatase